MLMTYIPSQSLSSMVCYYSCVSETTKQKLKKELKSEDIYLTTLLSHCSICHRIESSEKLPRRAKTATDELEYFQRGSSRKVATIRMSRREHDHKYRKSASEKKGSQVLAIESMLPTMTTSENFEEFEGSPMQKRARNIAEKLMSTKERILNRDLTTPQNNQILGKSIRISESIDHEWHFTDEEGDEENKQRKPHSGEEHTKTISHTSKPNAKSLADLPKTKVEERSLRMISPIIIMVV